MASGQRIIVAAETCTAGSRGIRWQINADPKRVLFTYLPGIPDMVGVITIDMDNTMRIHELIVTIFISIVTITIIRTNNSNSDSNSKSVLIVMVVTKKSLAPDKPEYRGPNNYLYYFLRGSLL